jgi:hypothetical protein
VQRSLTTSTNANTNDFPPLGLGDEKVGKILVELRQIKGVWAVTGSLALFLLTRGQSRQPADIDILVDKDATYWLVAEAIFDSKLFGTPNYAAVGNNGSGTISSTEKRPLQVDLAIQKDEWGKVDKNVVIVNHPTLGAIPVVCMKELCRLKKSILQGSNKTVKEMANKARVDLKFMEDFMQKK